MGIILPKFFTHWIICSLLRFYITSVLVLFNNTVCCYINLTTFQVNSVVQCIFSSSLLQLIWYFIIALVLTKSLFYKSVVVLQSFASHLEKVRRGQMIFMEQSTLSFKHQYSSFAPTLFLISHQIDFFGCLSKKYFIVLHFRKWNIRFVFSFHIQCAIYVVPLFIHGTHTYTACSVKSLLAIISLTILNIIFFDIIN